MVSQRTSWERFSLAELEKELITDFKRGLESDDVVKRQELLGKNVLERERGLGLFGKVLRQFKGPLVLILLVANVVTLFLGAFIDATVIFIALLINVVVGTFQEERASRAFEKLNASQEHFATVIREGRKIVIPAEELVPGDVVFIEAGSYVPADLRLIEEKELSINESALTGEWVAVSKELRVFEKRTPIAELTNMAWMGTLVVAGYGSGVVVETGLRTQVGFIAGELGKIEKNVTPLQRNIRHVARFLAVIIGVGIALIFALGLIRGVPVNDMLFMSIAIAVAAIPSGLPAAVTIVLALGMEAILKRGGLVRNLLAAETLGATTIVLTDKTGTLTEAKMKVASLYTYESLEKEGRETWTDDDRELLKASVLASDAFIEEVTLPEENASSRIKVHGRPIESAIVLAGLDAGLSQHELKETYQRLDFLQFESGRRYSVSLNQIAVKKRRAYISGAPETLLAKSDYVYKGGRAVALTSEIKEQFTAVQEKKSAEGLRFIGIAYKDVNWKIIPEKRGGKSLEEQTGGLTFLGFVSFEDPIRPDVKDAIKAVTGAGARVVMVTGDNAGTALKVACEVGISCDKYDVTTGADIEESDDDQLYELLMNTKVFARTLPEQKLRISRVLKNRGEVVAMTGDGINDAPALRSADIGIAVGSGTEVAKEAADIILLNNSFSIIEAAIEEGRKIIDNLKKIIAYLLSTSFSGISLVGVALVVGAPLPLLPVQLLWANIIEEGLMSFSFAFEKKEAGLMKRDPRAHKTANIMTPALKKLIILVAGTTSVFLLALYFILLKIGLPIEEIRTIMFVSLSLDAIFFSFSLKSLSVPIWRINPFSNVYLLVSLTISILILIAAVTLPPLQKLLTLTPLALWQVALFGAIGIFNLMVIETMKYALFRREQ